MGQLKPRIVGIIVLLFLALILFPWLFGSNQPVLFEDKVKLIKHKVNVSHSHNMLAVSSPPVISSGLNEESENVPSEQLTQTKPLPQERIDHSETTILTSNEATEDHTKLANIESAIIHTQTAASHVQSTKIVKHEKLIDKHAKAIELKRPDLSKLKIKSEKPSSNEGVVKLWSIQLGSFSNQDNVSKLMKQLKDKHYPVYTRQVDGEKITKVFVGPLVKAEAAQQVQQIEKLTKVHGILVKKSS